MAKSYLTTDEDFQAESDANTLMEYQAIKGDKKRHKAAMECIERKLKQLKMAKSDSNSLTSKKEDS